MNASLTSALAYVVIIKVSAPSFLNKSCLKQQFLRAARLCNFLKQNTLPCWKKKLNMELQQQKKTLFYIPLSPSNWLFQSFPAVV